MEIVMAKLQDCQFIEIKIDGKAVAGASEEKNFNKWMEGFSEIGLASFSGPDGTYFDGQQISILVTKETGDLFEKLLQRGYKDITITIVHRGSDQYEKDYEVQRTVYTSCKVFNMNFVMREHMFMDITFTFEGNLEITFNVPNSTSNGLDKIGPIKYSIPEKALK